MLIASKYEEMYAPEVADFVYITDNAYTKKEIRDMEGIILRTLDFSVGKPLCLHFLRRNSKAGQVKITQITMISWLKDINYQHWLNHTCWSHEQSLRPNKKNMCVYGHPTNYFSAADPINFYTEFG